MFEELLAQLRAGQDNEKKEIEILPFEENEGADEEMFRLRVAGLDGEIMETVLTGGYGDPSRPYRIEEPDFTKGVHIFGRMAHISGREIWVASGLWYIKFFLDEEGVIQVQLFEKRREGLEEVEDEMWGRNFERSLEALRESQ